MANMFGALNRFISRLDSDQPQRSNSTSLHGFQVLRNRAQELAIEPWFDFVIGINGRNLDNPDPSLFSTEVRNCAGSTISLGIYSAKGQQMRELYVPVSKETGSLGLSLQWTSLSAAEDVWHILDVIPNSPADTAGLLPYSDYVICSPEGLMRGENGLGELIEDFLNRPLRLFVYNNEYDVTREVTITPSRSWGGDGALGCVLGFGALHRVPAPLTEPPQAPGETLFETARFSNEESRPSPSISQNSFQPANRSSPAPEYLVPANLQFSAAPPPQSAGDGTVKGTRKARAHHAISPTAGIDDYFKEGEEKSRELDRGSTPLSSSGLPPPPKSGPPKAAKSPAPE